MRAAHARPSLGPAFGMRTRQFSGGNQALSLAVSIAPGRDGRVVSQTLDLTRSDAAIARMLSASITATLSPKTRLALGISRDTNHAASLATGRQIVPFLVAGEARGDLGQDLVASTALTLTHDLGGSMALQGGFTSGSARRQDMRAQLFSAVAARPARYQSAYLGLIGTQGPLSLTASGEVVSESGSLLGARLASAFGAQSARSLFAEAGLALHATSRLSFSGTWRQGWTRAAAGGALLGGGTLATRSWSADASLADWFTPGDVTGLRFSAPLRVTKGQFLLTLPVTYDWQTGVTESRVTPLNLMPTGHERNVELVHGRPVAGGWIDGHVYWRRDAGNIAAMPDDIGSALRWSVNF
jgi:hypothetical protein